jgi:carboxylesterase
MLAPAFFLPRRAQLALRVLRKLGGLTRVLYLRSYASDIHDDNARSVHPTTHLMPLSAPMELMDLSKLLRPRMGRITQPALVIHSRQDHTCPFERNVNFVTRRLGSERQRLVALEQSFHVITVDTEKARVADEVLAFVDQFRVAPRRTATA